MSKATPSPVLTGSDTPDPSVSESAADTSAQAGDSALDWFAMFLDFIANISWPLLITMILIMLLNKKIQKALSSGLTRLAKTFKSFKVGGVEAVLNDDEIQETLEDNKDGLEESTRELQENLPTSSGLSLSVVTYETPVSREPVKDPRIIALEAYNILESFIAKTADDLNEDGEAGLDHPKNKKYASAAKPKTMSKLLAELSEHEVISPAEETTVTNLREIRNEIAHDVASVEMSAETARSYRKQCKQVIGAISNRIASKLKDPTREPGATPEN